MSETQSEPAARREPEPTLTWARDLRRVVAIRTFGVLFFTFLVWAATAGLLREKGSFDTLEGDPLWAGICAGALLFLSPLPVL